MSGSDGLLLVLVGALSRQIKDLHGEVLEGRGQEDAASDAYLSRVSSLLDHSGTATNWEDQAGFERIAAALGSSLSLAASFAFSCHFLVQSQWGIEVSKFKFNRFKSTSRVFKSDFTAQSQINNKTRFSYKQTDAFKFKSNHNW